MARLLPICLVLLFLVALLTECEGRRNRNMKCCYRSRCRSGKTKCCRSRGRKRVCKRGRCVRSGCKRSGRDVEEEPEQDMANTRDMEEDISAVDTLFNP